MFRTLAKGPVEHCSSAE